MKRLLLLKFSYDRMQFRKWCNVLYSNVFFNVRAWIIMFFRFFFFGQKLYRLNENLTIWYRTRKMFAFVPLDNFGQTVLIGSRKLYFSYDFLIVYTGLYPCFTILRVKKPKQACNQQSAGTLDLYIYPRSLFLSQQIHFKPEPQDKQILSK